MSDAKTPSQTDRLDELLSVLADSDRRAVIAHLRDAPTETATPDELATMLATHSTLDRDYARMQLHHAHLPKLAEIPGIEYDPDTKIVYYHGHPELESLLDTLKSHETTATVTEPNVEP